eukprot:CAMPEP_0167806500 /NCGR_PEP_ID=MMETSP0111_2-20121227/21880_1 /TAXON_ID=91324 /ORGANISM="Lotharella globosa, Strain CCCM811" /LENGTH=356 /DNA_ID=CAMNT_0007703995 /DNA_START=57 /DNA_END=1127 /DNA_ORIENTATION=-
MSINTYYATAEPSTSSIEEESVPPPQPQVTERLFQPRYSGRVRQRRKPSSWQNQPSLAKLFKPPDDINFKGSFEQAADEASSAGSWLLVNIQDPLEFKCHQLNRDVWNKAEVRGIIEGSFILWQQENSSKHGQWYCSFYGVREFPHVAILNPKTRQIAKIWENVEDVVDVVSFQESLTEFLRTNSRASSKRQKREHTSSSTQDDDLLQAAIQASLEESATSSRGPKSEIKQHQGKQRPEPGPDVKVVSSVEISPDIKAAVKVSPEPDAGPSVTTLRVRLPSTMGGEQLRRRFFKKASIQNVIDFVWDHMLKAENVPGKGIENLVLKTTFPRRTLNKKATLQDSKLLNAVVQAEFDD